MELRAGARWVDPAHPWSTPQSSKWPMQGRNSSKVPATSRRGPQVASPPLFKQSRSRPRGSGLQCTSESGQIRGRVTALGESDPTHSTLQDAMKKARSQVHVRPVDGVSHPQKRSSSVRRRGSECAAQGTGSPCAGSEEEGLAEGEVRLVAHLKMSFLPFIEFWPFLGLRIFSMFLPQNEFWPFKGPS